MDRLAVDRPVRVLGRERGRHPQVAFYGGSLDQLWRQFVASGAVTLFSFAVAAGLARILKAAKILRADEDAEVGGIDISDHGETAYDMTPVAGSGGGAFAMAGVGGQKTADVDGQADVSEKVAG